MYEAIQRRLKTYAKKKQSAPHLRPASVLLPLFKKAGELSILFTRRTDNVEHHKGQISFPGGMRDPADPDSVSTAIRETWEEIGIEPSSIQIIGELDDHPTVSGFNITPFVGKIAYPFTAQICEEELSELFSVPLSFFLEGSNCKQEYLVDSDGKKREFFVFQYQNYRIWGATAAITRNFIEVIA
jgi:8-oxo-dGTP pyrophosphatase MutT (NUDIX family)